MIQFRNRVFQHRNRKRGPGDERGAVLVLVALSVFVLIGFLALVFDVGTFYLRRRNMQTAADAGALAGAAEIFRAESHLAVSAAHAATGTNGFANGTDGVDVTVNIPPGSGFYSGRSGYVEVLIRQPSPTFFAKIFGIDWVQIPARAVAVGAAASPNCVYVLDPLEPALHVESSAQLITNCGIVVNSPDECGMHLYSESSVDTGGADISIVGGWCADGGAAVEPSDNVIHTRTSPSSDPLADMKPPTGIPIVSASRLEIDTDRTLAPGTYKGGILIKSGVNVTLQPGTYVMEGGGLTVEGGITGDGVIIYNTYNTTGDTYQPILFKNPSTADLSAPTTVPYEGGVPGVLFYQDRTALSDVNFKDDYGLYGDGFILETESPTNFDGVLYFPTQRVRIKNKANPRMTNLLVAASVVVESQSTLDMSGTTSGVNPLHRFTLVE